MSHAAAVSEPLQSTAVIVSQQDLSRLSLEELAQVDVTSVSRRPEALAVAAASVFVINREDIRRSGAASLPEVLRLAPNLSVQRVNAVDYAIIARGFNGFETANKMLVLVDGRSIYSTLASGVFWDARDLPLAEIERIEVVSGPGGALYGANAVNGVINIITRPATETQGTEIQAGAGNEDATLSFRQGGLLPAGAWRAFVSGFRRDDTFRLTGADANDAAKGVRAGARADWTAGQGRMTLQGDVFENQVAINEDFSGVDTHVRGGNLLGRWSSAFAGGDLQVQAYYDRFEREEPISIEETDTYDISIQHERTLGRHTLVVGAGHRTIQSSYRQEPGGAFLDPAERTLTLDNVFANDQIALTDGLTLTLGAKFESNSFSGDEFLPSARLAWARPGGDLVWGAISRASRTPNRIERDLTLPGFLVGGNFQSETLTAYELGYRANPAPNLSFSVSAFYNVYDNLRTATTTPVTVFPLRLTNFGSGETWGVEAWGSWDVSPRWRLSGGLSTLDKDLGVDRPELDITGLASKGDDADYQLLIRSQTDLTDRLELDLNLRAIDDLLAADGYVEAGVRLGWRVSDRLELSVSGENLLEDRHVETGDPARRRAFGRSVYASLRVGF